MYFLLTLTFPSSHRLTSACSILLISPQNRILLLHRVKTSSSFPSAHVFPGGNLSAKQDGEIPSPNDPRRHVDGAAYRLGAIRECFEESGILLAKKRGSEHEVLQLPQQELERARKEIHAGKRKFKDWVAERGGVPDTEGLVPFTRWITPTNIPRRFTTQMYLYFLPLEAEPHAEGERGAGGGSKAGAAGAAAAAGKEVSVTMTEPTSDGGLEHTTATFDDVAVWLDKARRNEIILFPPQFYLMYLLAPFFSSKKEQSFAGGLTREELQRQRDEALRFVTDEDEVNGVSWAEKCISPQGLLMRKGDGRSVLALDRPGREVEAQGHGERKGDSQRVVLVKFGKEGPRDVEVRWKKEVLEEERRAKGEAKL